MKFNDTLSKKKPIALFAGLLMALASTSIFVIYLISPIDKQGIINIAKSQSCPIKLSFLHGTEFRYFEECIGIISVNYFRNFSLEDKKEIAVNFIIYANLQGGRSAAFMEMIDPFKEELIISLENISDSELNLKYQISGTEVDKYRQKIKSYKATLFNN
jgi:hypothetical protein